jgi:hypothetical protein
MINNIKIENMDLQCSEHVAVFDAGYGDLGGLKLRAPLFPRESFYSP